MATTETWNLPSNYQIEPELREQLSSRPGHQRCVDGEGELLLVVHEVPKPRIPEREVLLFWKRRDGSWLGPTREGLGDLSDLLDRYAKVIDGHEEVIEEADTAEEIFGILSHTAPLSRSTRNLVAALEQVLHIDSDDRGILNLRDRAREIDRAADLLNSDARLTLEFWRAERAEQQAESGERLNQIAFRLNLLAGFFLPLVALGGLFGMNVDLPEFVKPLFWVIVFGGLITGSVILVLVGRHSRKGAGTGKPNADKH